MLDMQCVFPSLKKSMGFLSRFHQPDLPRFQLQPKPSLGEPFLRIGLTVAGTTMGSILVFYWSEIPESLSSAIYAIALNVLVFISVAYIAQLHFRKTPRYARCIVHIHYVMDSIRDVLASLREMSLDQNKDKSKMEDVVAHQLSHILTAIASAFSIVTGHNCAVCVKEVRGEEVRTISRDIFSSASRRKIDLEKNSKGQLIDDATGSQSVIRGEVANRSYYLANNLPRLFKLGQYKNPGQQGTKWNLPYSSTLIVPIRYIPKLNARQEANHESAIGKGALWGLLCIDSPSRKCFRASIDPDLAMAFGDALFVLFSQAALMSRIQINQPSMEHVHQPS